MKCKNCGLEFEDTYCSHCGEKKFDRKQLSINHFVEETFESFIHFDNKFLLSLKTLLTRPGQLSLDYTNGKRVRFMKPIQLFLVINLIFFFVGLKMGNLFSLNLYNYVTYKPFIEYNTRAVIDNKLKKEHLTYKEYEQQFNEKMWADSKEFIFVYIPFYGILFALLFIRSKKMFIEHTMFALHFVSFAVAYFLITAFLIELPFALISKSEYSQDFDNVFTLFTIASFAVYLGFAARKFYGSSVWWSVVSALLVAGTFFVFIQYYRMFLFSKIVHFG